MTGLKLFSGITILNDINFQEFPYYAKIPVKNNEVREAYVKFGLGQKLS